LVGGALVNESQDDSKELPMI